MKKTFPLRVPGKEDQRVVEAIKNEVRKYVKRERRKALPAGVDFWDFACKVGQDQLPPASRHMAEVTGAIEAAAKNGGTTVYVEILSTPGHRTKKIVSLLPDGTTADSGPPVVSAEP
jgi:hypothetical protein